MVRTPHRLSLPVAAIFLLTLSGCFFSREPVRHLASDVCLITPDLTQKQVLDILGPPNHQKHNPEEGGETWIYYEVKKSVLRKTPYIGDRLGNEDYELITISFVGGQVRTCAYRALKEGEFKALGIPAQ